MQRLLWLLQPLGVFGRPVRIREIRALNVAEVSIDQEIVYAKSTPKLQKGTNERYKNYCL